MKICLINNLYKPYDKGGTEKIVELLNQGLKENGNETFIITTKPPFANKENNKEKKYQLNSLYYNLEKIPLPLRLFWHIIDMFDFAKAIKVKNILKKEQADIVITNNLKGLGFLIPRIIKTKHIHILHDIQLIHPSGLMFWKDEKKTTTIFAQIYTCLCKYLFASPNIVISPSQWLLNFYDKNNFFKNSQKIVLPNPAIINKQIIKTEKNNKKFQFLYVGQIEYHKGVLFLIKTFLSKELKNKDWELIIVGDGSNLEKTQKQAKKNKNIKFLGRLNRQEVNTAMQSADCLIVSSICYENSPTVIYEAATNALPVLASDLGGNTELINKLGGVLFKPNNKKDLLNKLNYILDNKKDLEKQGLMSKEKIEKFKLKNYIKNFIAIIKN